jgi:hypothetical protein
VTLPSRQWHRLDERIGRVMDGVTVLVPDDELRFVRQFLAVGEQGFGIDNLLRILIATRAALQAETRDVLLEVVRALGAPRFRPELPYLFDPHGVVGLLDLEDRPGRRRGLPPLRGGHVGSARGTCSTSFPPGWTQEAVHAAAHAVRADPDLTPVVLPNGMEWTASPPEPIGVGVLTAGGDLTAVVPVRPRREWSQPRYVDRERPVPTELLIACVYTNGVGVLPALRGHVTAAQFEALSELAVAGEIDVVADIAAVLAAQRPGLLTPDERRLITRLLRSFDLPVHGCDHLNDRDAILARLDRR